MVGQTAIYMQQQRICVAHLSISHEKEYAIAVVVLEKDDTDKIIDFQNVDLYKMPK